MVLFIRARRQQMEREREKKPKGIMGKVSNELIS